MCRRRGKKNRKGEWQHKRRKVTMFIGDFEPQARRNAVLLEMGYKDYAEYLKSPLWGKIRKSVLVRDGKKCCRCDQKANQVHHRDYTREALMGDDTSDMVSICAACHEFIEYLGTAKLDLATANARLTIPCLEPVIRAKKKRKKKEKSKPSPPKTKAEVKAEQKTIRRRDRKLRWQDKIDTADRKWAARESLPSVRIPPDWLRRPGKVVEQTSDPTAVASLGLEERILEAIAAAGVANTEQLARRSCLGDLLFLEPQDRAVVETKIDQWLELSALAV
jgi:hypothetical protein